MSDPYIGQITMFGFNFPPRGWAFCSGALLPVSQNTALFSLLSTFYGGDGRTTFGLPNLTSRAPIGFNMGNPLGGLETYPIGQAWGAQYRTLSTAEMPTHTHMAMYTPTPITTSISATTEDGETETPTAGAYLAKAADIPGPDAPEKIYKLNPTPSSLVNLGGVSSTEAPGSVQVSNTGGSQSFSIQNPALAINFSIALLGNYPPRN